MKLTILIQGSDLARLIIEHGADVNAVDPDDNNSALILAIIQSNQKYVKSLSKR